MVYKIFSAAILIFFMAMSIYYLDEFKGANTIESKINAGVFFISYNISFYAFSILTFLELKNNKKL